MNKFPYSLLSMLVVALLFIATGCKDDDSDPSADPSIRLESSHGESATVDPGTAVDIKVIVNAPAGFSSLEITKAGGNAETFEPVMGEEGQTSLEHAFNYSPSIEEAGETIVLTFKSTDNEGLELTQSYTITVNSPTISSYENVMIGGRFNKQKGHFYSMLDNQVYHLAEAQQHPERVDFMFYYNDAKEFTITAPSDEYARIIYPDGLDLEGMDNATFFAAATGDTNYGAITEPEHIIDAWNKAAVKAKEENGFGPMTVIHYIAIGDVFVFQLDETRGSRYGIAEVTALTNESPGTRTVTLNIKITMQSQN